MESRHQRAEPLSVLILHKAKELFGRKGFDAVSLREIAEACEVSKPALYYHFESKEALALKLIEDGFIEIFHEIDSMALSQDDTPLDLLNRTMKLYFEFAKRDVHWVSFVFSLILLVDEPALFSKINELDAVTHQKVYALFARFEENGMLRPGSIDSMITQMNGSFFIMLTALTRRWCGEFKEEHIRALAADIIFGVSGSKYSREQHPDLLDIRNISFKPE
jgi:AcrR family transcriptional regulator